MSPMSPDSSPPGQRRSLPGFFPPSALWILAGLILTDMCLWLSPPGSFLRIVSAVLLIMVLPGLAWVHWFIPEKNALFRSVFAMGLSLVFTSLLLLALHALPGKIDAALVSVPLNLIAISGTLHAFLKAPESLFFNHVNYRRALSADNLALLIVLCAAAYLCFSSLGASEFQGDESLVMISAADALEGHEDALLLRSKGPGEVLLPMAIWPLTGVINESSARLPFALLSLATVILIYLAGRELFSRTAGILAALFLTFNGFGIGFSRIVQYQAIVLFCSAMAVLLILYWRQTNRFLYLPLSGLFLGVGLLAHYDALMALPAVLWLIVEFGLKANGRVWTGKQRLSAILKMLFLFFMPVILVAASFYLSYLVDPQALRTGSYLGSRLGEGGLKNHLRDFLHFLSFYSSFYYLALSGGLILVFAGLRLRNWRGFMLAAAPALLVLSLVLLARPGLLHTESFDGAGIVFGLFFLVLLCTPKLTSLERACILWLAVPFCGYNFLVATPLTHIYTTMPAWSLLAPLGLGRLLQMTPNRLLILAAAGCALFLPFDHTAFIRPSPAYLPDYPRANLPFYWSPYAGKPATGFFGFFHHAGWKEAGVAYQRGWLSGDYSSNEEEPVTAWYLRNQPRACDSAAENIIMAAQVVDRTAVKAELEKDYRLAGLLPDNASGDFKIYSRAPLLLPELAPQALSDSEAAFDAGAVPAAFARAAHPRQDIRVDFGRRIMLLGYALDTRRAAAGGRITVTLYWQAQKGMQDDYHVFVHLESDKIYAQSDGLPACWNYPTSAWRDGQVITDHHALSLPADIPPGKYPLLVGWYNPADGSRLEILDNTGQPVANNYSLAEIEIK